MRPNAIGVISPSQWCTARASQCLALHGTCRAPVGAHTVLCHATSVPCQVGDDQSREFGLRRHDLAAVVRLRRRLGNHGWRSIHRLDETVRVLPMALRRVAVRGVGVAKPGWQRDEADRWRMRDLPSAFRGHAGHLGSWAFGWSQVLTASRCNLCMQPAETRHFAGAERAG